MDEPTQQPKKEGQKKWLAIVGGIIIVVLLALIGYLWWQLMLCNQAHRRLEDEKKTLQMKIDELSKAVSTEPTDDKTEPCSSTITAAFKDNIKAAVSSHNYAALVGSMTDPVNVVLAASEKGGGVTPAQAATDMQYLNGGALPWDFALPAATISSYQAGFYTSYFGANTFVGKASDGMVVSFDFNDCAKIKQIFISAHEDLLKP